MCRAQIRSALWLTMHSSSWGPLTSGELLVLVLLLQMMW